MQGLHLTADLTGCAPGQPRMLEPEALRAACLAAVRQAGLQAVGELFHRFPAPGGVTGVVLLAESHLAVHTWPELAAVTLDVYVCNLQADNSARAESLLAALQALFVPVDGPGDGPGDVPVHAQVQRLQRGRRAAP
jgi:S-adenosylmethionine decarboxylase proenzyme